MRKCRNCLCRTCVNICCNRQNCPGKKRLCDRYNRAEQERFDFLPPKETYRPAPRAAWEDYGLGDKKRRDQLMEMAQSAEYAEIAAYSAHIAAPEIERYILLATKENLSYEGLERLWSLGKIERMPYGKTDFYGIRRYFFAIMDEKIRNMGK